VGRIRQALVDVCARSAPAGGAASSAPKGRKPRVHGAFRRVGAPGFEPGTSSPQIRAAAGRQWPSVPVPRTMRLFGVAHVGDLSVGGRLLVPTRFQDRLLFEPTKRQIVALDAL
jgi:hypothetical protein